MSQVNMPVFFYIDPEFADDPAMDNVDNITLSYTFFQAKPGMSIPLPGFMRQWEQQHITKLRVFIAMLVYDEFEVQSS